MSRRFRSLSITNSRGAPAPSGGITICHENNRLAPHELRAESFRGGPPIHIAQKPQENRHTRERFSLYRPIRDGRCAATRDHAHTVQTPHWWLPVGLEAMVHEHRPAARLCQVRKSHPVRSSRVVVYQHAHAVVRCDILCSGLFHSGANVVECPQLSGFPSQSFSDAEAK
jgi:hypothetical protein